MLIRHSLVYVLAKLMPGLIGMATTAVLTRLLDPPGYGLFGASLVVMSLGTNLAFDWLGLSFLRFYQARTGDPRVISTFVRMYAAVVALTAVLAVAAWLAGAFGAEHSASVGIGLVLMWAYSWFELSSRFAIAEFRPGPYLRMNLGRAVLAMAGAVGAAWLTRDPVWTAAGMALGTLGGAALGGRSQTSLGRRQFDPALARAAASFGLPLAASLILGGLVNSGTRALVGTLGSLEALGLYTAAFILVQNTLGVMAAGIASASYSLAVRAVDTGDAEAARRQLMANGTLLLAVLAPTSLGMALLAHGIAETLVAPAYVDTVARLTPWMAAGAFFGGYRAHYLDHAFQLGKRPNLQVGVTAVAGAVAIGLAVPLIPRWGPLGAAVAVAVAMAVSCVHAKLAGRQAYALPAQGEAMWRVGVACLAMTSCVLLVPGHGIPSLAARVALGGGAYAAAAMALDVLGSRTAWVRLLARRRGEPVRP